MIELTQLNGNLFTLNSDLIETIENIPETKVLLTNGKYFLVCEKRDEIVRKVVSFRRRIYRDLITLQEVPEETRAAVGGRGKGLSAKPKRKTSEKRGAGAEDG